MRCCWCAALGAGEREAMLGAGATAPRVPARGGPAEGPVVGGAYPRWGSEALFGDGAFAYGARDSIKGGCGRLAICGGAWYPAAALRGG